MLYRNFLMGMAALAIVFTFGCATSETAGGATLAAVCVDDATELEGNDWLCPDNLSVECEDGGADPERIYLEPSGDLPERCEEIELSLSDEGPFEVGTHEIVVTAEASNGDGESAEVTCEATLTVEDTRPPDANVEAIELWPPNHKFHTISGEDCVRDACDGEVQVTFLWASSDEPVNDKGDGNTEPDIILECDRVQLRSERQGGGNGRTYRLGWTAVDDAGNRTKDGECVVRVPHDQSGKDVEDTDQDDYTVYHDAPSECDDGTGGAGGFGGMGGAGGVGGAGGEGGQGGTGGAGGTGGPVVQ